MKNTLIRLAFLSALLTPLLPQAALAAGPQVATASGPVTGLADGKVEKFLGIPFAEPPVGDLRWKAPQPAKSWTAPRDATRHATRCSAPEAGDGVRLVNEDCLYLDIYRPAGTAADAKLPVLVYIHGGGNYSGSTDIYDGSRFAEVTHSIVVMPAYRLGVFGFMALPALGKEDPANASGGYGLLDNIASLEWIKANIADFGGDAANITLTGQSAGGTNLCSLLAAPGRTKGLFQRVVIQSGVCQINPSLAASEKAGAEFAAALGCADPATELACMRGKPAGEILDKWKGNLTGAAFGTPLLPKAPMEALAAGEFVRVPALVGFADREMWGFMHSMYPLSDENYGKAVKNQFGDKAAELFKRYPTQKFLHNEYAMGAIQGDSFIVCHAFAIADRLAKYTPVSMYDFADNTVPNWKSLGNAQPAPPGYHVGAGHTAELFYMLGYKAIEAPLNAEQQALGDEMDKRWLAFGKPEGKTLWPPYSADKRDLVTFKLAGDGGIKVEDKQYARHNCDFWNR